MRERGLSARGRKKKKKPRLSPLTVAQQQQVLVMPAPAHRTDDGVQPGDGGGVGVEVGALGRKEEKRA